MAAPRRNVRYVAYPDEAGNVDIPADQQFVKYVRYDDVLGGKYDDARYPPPRPPVVRYYPPPAPPTAYSPARPTTEPPTPPRSPTPSTTSIVSRERKREPIDLCVVLCCCLLFFLIVLFCLYLISPRLFCFRNETMFSETTATVSLDTKATVTRLFLDVENYEKLNFTDAAIACEKRLSKLAFPLVELQEADIEDKLQTILEEDRKNIEEKCGGFEFFIGVRRNRAREWMSSDGLLAIDPDVLENPSVLLPGDQCVQLFIFDEADGTHNGTIISGRCDNSNGQGESWECYVCEYDCYQGICNYSLVKFETGGQMTQKDAEVNCSESFEGGMLANVYHERLKDIVVDAIYNESKEVDCWKPLIGTKYTEYYEDIYENPLTYNTKKIFYGDKNASNICVTIDAEKIPYRWTLNMCTEKFCFLCYSN